MIDFIASIFDHIIHVAIRLFVGAMNFLESALRGPLEAIHIHGALETLLLTMIPLLTIVAVVKLFGGIFRAVLVVVLVLMLAHIALPLFTSSSG